MRKLNSAQSKKFYRILKYAEFLYFVIIFIHNFHKIMNFKNKYSEICENKQIFTMFVVFMLANFCTVSKFPRMAFTPFATFCRFAS